MDKGKYLPNAMSGGSSRHQRGGIRMGNSSAPVRSVAATDEELRELGRSDREARERREAMSRAEQAGRLASGTGLDLPERSEQEIARFGAQLSRIEASAFAMPSVDAVLSDGGRHRRESLQLAGSLHEAEQAELRLENASEQAGPPRA
jgi:hypothetical protein